MRDSRRCPKCSHHEIVFLPSIPDRIGSVAGAGTVTSLAIGKREVEGWLGPAFEAIGQFAACICRRCGFTELYAWQPELIPVNDIPGAQLLVGKPPSPYR
jgi:hypothetical protein